MNSSEGRWYFGVDFGSTRSTTWRAPAMPAEICQRRMYVVPLSPVTESAYAVVVVVVEPPIARLERSASVDFVWP